jgi:hypothetical protein
MSKKIAEEEIIKRCQSFIRGVMVWKATWESITEPDWFWNLIIEQ